MVNTLWFLIDLLLGFLLGFILVCFIETIKHFLYYKIRSLFMRSLSLNKYRVTQGEKLSLVSSTDLSRTWMYELREEIYDVHHFSFSMTHICLIEIKKNILFVFQPAKEPNRKLNNDELDSKVIFNQVRIYNLNQAVIGLLPVNMKRSKYWSKKTPIVLQDILYLSNEMIQTSLTANLSLPSKKSNKNNVRETLFLFTRTRRSKEDWFYRFLNASQLDSWRGEIRYQLEQDETIDTSRQSIMTKSVGQKDNASKVNDDQRHNQKMIDLLRRTDRFAAPDQLHYLKPVDVVQKFVPTLRKKWSRHIRSSSNHKQQYCERWLMEQNQTDVISTDETTNDNSKRSPVSRYFNDNHTENQSSQLSLWTDSNQYQYQAHPLLFFLFKYLQKIPHNTKENNIENPIFLLNIFAARCFLDVFDHQQYLERFKNFLQKQLRKVKVPFIEHIIVTNLNLGDRLPEIKEVFEPWIDEHGLWSHVKISYDGKLQLTLTAKLKWIRRTHLTEQTSHKNTSISRSKRNIDQEKIIPVKRSWRQRLWPPSSCFQRRRSIPKTSSSPRQETFPSSDLEKVNPKISKTTIVIKLEVNNLHGILLFNIPPIPSDRLWISFLDMPDMEFSVTPHLGEYRVPFYRIKRKLEEKLRQTFRRYLVMPNMKDFILPTVNDYLLNSDFIKVISSDVKANN